LLTLPAATGFGAIAAWVALSGPVGVVVIVAALLAGSLGIFAISRRTAVNHSNVNDSRDVVVQFGRGAAEPTLPVTIIAAGNLSPVTSPLSLDQIIPITIESPPMTPPTDETTTVAGGQQ
jgi:uncharacterized membrane protein